MSVRSLIVSSAGARAIARAPAHCIVSGHGSGVAGLKMAMLVLLSFFGCGRSESRFEREPPANPTPVEASGPLQLRLEGPTQVRSGEAVPLRLMLANPSDRPVEVELEGDPIAFDLVVTASDGAEVWRRLEGTAVADILVPRTVPPNAEIDFADTWTQRSNDGRRVGPGVYRVRGILPVVDPPGGWVTETITLTVLP